MRKQRKDNGPTEPVTDEAHVSTPSYDPPQSGEDSMQLSELMNLCTSLQEKVLDLEKAKTGQAKEIASLKKREDASKQGRKIDDLDADAEVTLVDESQEMNDENLMFDTDVLEEQEKEVAKKEVSTTNPVTTAGETLIEIKAAKPKAVTSAATTTTTTRPKARGVVVQEPSEFKTTSSTSQASQHPQAKDKGKVIMVEPKRPLKKKDQVALDEEMDRNPEARIQAELIEEERLTRQKEEEANIALIESWDNTQAMMEAYFELAQMLQAEEHGEITIEERSRLFVELMNRRKKHFAKLRAKEIRRNLPTKAQKRNQMSIYLKNMVGYKHKEEEMKNHMEIVQDKEEIAIDVIPLAKKPLMIVEYKIVKEGQKGFYHLIRADGSSKRYSLMIRMLQGTDKEDLETLWKLVKEKNGINRPVDEYERVLGGDMKSAL
ncbi:hypothetical protein Tco_0737584 [Tanacetum coccineum]